MIVRIKLGDLTARQVVKICRAYNSCLACPLHKPDDPKRCAFVDEDITPCDLEGSLDREIKISTDIVSPEKAVSFEDELQKTRQWMKNAEFEYVRLQNTFWHLCHILGYREGGFNPAALWWNIVKAFDSEKPDEPYQYKPKVCVEDENDE